MLVHECTFIRIHSRDVLRQHCVVCPPVLRAYFSFRRRRLATGYGLVNPFLASPLSGIFFLKKKISRSKKLASLSVWRLRPDWTEVRFGMTPLGRASSRALATVSLRGIVWIFGNDLAGRGLIQRRPLRPASPY